ncbi:MAG: cadherin-like beta sandwich domain-containing protein [Bacilli bacterium]|nr:cadherin-like beta sandwich domain-containing protein [Bacilli bacterium]
MFGGYLLNYGVNNFNIKVQAEDGTIKTYTIAVTRLDTRSDDSTLKNITLSDGTINFNSNTKNYDVDVTSSSVKLTATATDSNAKVEYLNGSTFSLNYGETKTAKIKVTSEKGTTSTYSITLTRKDTRSNDSTLKSISLSDGNINFNSNTKNYNVTVNASKVTLYATKNNEYATVTYPNGNSVNLEYGQTATLKVKVTAQTGATSIYTINLTRKDARSSDNTLKSLAVSNTNIKYNNKTTVYNAQVENNIESISISATANNSKARINGTGTKSLDVGNNSFIVKVTAENGDVQEYIIVINRKVKVTNKEDKTNKTDNNTPVKLSSDNYLKSLKIEEVALDFSKTITDYNVFVDYNITNINLSYEVSSSKAIVSMTGETNLQVGLNIIKLIVVAENGDVRTYTLNINRRPERNIVENTEIAIMSAINSSDMDDIYIVAEQQSAPYNMSSSILNSLSQTGKTIIYEIVDDGAVIYQLKLIGGEIINSSGFNFEVLFNSTKEHELKELVNSALYLPVRFNYSGEIPGKLYLNIYNANEKIVSSDNLKLYEYETDKNKLNLINSIETYENVIELKIGDVDKEYVLIDNLIIANSLSDEDDNKSNNNVFYTILLSVAIVLVIILIILVIKKFINKKKNSIVPNADMNDSDKIEMLDNDNL